MAISLYARAYVACRVASLTVFLMPSTHMIRNGESALPYLVHLSYITLSFTVHAENISPLVLGRANSPGSDREFGCTASTEKRVIVPLVRIFHPGRQL